MRKNDNLKKILVSILTLCLLMQIVCIPVIASKGQSNVTTTVVIEDLETGEVTQYEVIDDNEKTFHGIDEKGRAVTTTTVEIGDSKTRAGQSNNNTFGGWKGVVSITYTDNGTTASLTKATGNWSKVGDTQSISKLSMTYGQDLGTNGRSASIGLSTNSTTSVNPSWPAGKYGYGLGHKVGANIFATIGGKSVGVYCQKSF